MDLEGTIDFDAVGYLDEWDSAVHAKFLAVKSHAALDMAVACPLFLGVKRQGQRFVFRYTANREFALHIKGSRTGLHNFGGMKRDVRVVFGIEEVFAFQFVVLHAAPRVYGVCKAIGIPRADRLCSISDTDFRRKVRLQRRL